MSEALSPVPAPAAPLAPSDQIQVQRDLWQHRRTMAFVALWSVVLLIPLMFALCSAVPDAVVTRVSQLQALIIGFAVPLITFAGAYMGLATVYGDNSASNLTTPKG